MTGRIQPLIFKGDGSMVVDHPSYIHKPVSGQTLRVSSHLFAVRVLTSVYQATQPCHLTVLLCHEHTNTHTHKREWDLLNISPCELKFQAPFRCQMTRACRSGGLPVATAKDGTLYFGDLFWTDLFRFHLRTHSWSGIDVKLTQLRLNLNLKMVPCTANFALAHPLFVTLRSLFILRYVACSVVCVRNRSFWSTQNASQIPPPSPLPRSVTKEVVPTVNLQEIFPSLERPVKPSTVQMGNAWALNL